MTNKFTEEVRIDNKVIKRINAPWNVALDSIFKANGKVISSRDLAHARTQYDATHTINFLGSYVSEGVLYVPNNNPYLLLIRPSPLLDSSLAEQATQAHRSGKEAFIDEKLAQSYLDRLASKNTNVFALTDLTSVPTDRFADDERTVWLFQDVAQQYGEHLKANKRIPGAGHIG